LEEAKKEGNTNGEAKVEPAIISQVESNGAGGGGLSRDGSEVVANDVSPTQEREEKARQERFACAREEIKARIDLIVSILERKTQVAPILNVPLLPSSPVHAQSIPNSSSSSSSTTTAASNSSLSVSNGAILPSSGVAIDPVASHDTSPSKPNAPRSESTSITATAEAVSS
jgi:hypothetical protein